MSFLSDLKLYAFILLTGLLVSGCLKGDFDVPPIGGDDPDLPAEKILSVKQFLDTYYNPNAYVNMTDDVYIRGIVISSDQAGNIFKLLYIQDEDGSAGVSLAIDEVSMFNFYPIGKRVFIKINGLTIGANNGTPQIGKGTSGSGTRINIDRIPASLMREHVLPGKAGISIPPKVKKINELGNADLNTLVVIEDVEFARVGPNETYAISTPPTTVNLDLNDCNGNTIIVRNSGFAQFVNDILPAGNGKITAIYNVFGNTKQLFIRDTKDIDFASTRCSGGGGNTGDRISIKNLRAQYTGNDVTLTTGFIQGIVISDTENRNINGQNMVVQDGDSGILCRFKSAIAVPLGAEVKVGLAGGSLSQFRTLLQVSNLENANVEVLSTGNSVTPLKLSVSEVNLSIHESTLVTFEDVEISGGATFAGTRIVRDNSGEIDLFTLNTSSFGNVSVPTGKVSLTAIVSVFEGTKQLTMRNQNDVKGGGGGNPNPEGRISIRDLRRQFMGTSTTLTGGFVQGIVISDYENKNTNAQNLVVQDGDAGIVLRFTQAIEIPMGTEVKVPLAGGQLSQFNDLVQVQSLSNSIVEVIASNQTVTPRVLNISEIDLNLHESTLIQIKDATFESGTFSGSKKINDSTGNIDCFTNAAATFSSEMMPTGPKDITCIVSVFRGTKQVYIRRLADIE